MHGPTLLPYYPTTPLPYYPTTLLPYYPTTPPHYPTTPRPHYRTSLLPYSQAERAQEKPPPSQPMRVAIECYGLTMARGGGWMSFHAGDAAGASSSSSSSSSAASESDPTVIELKVHACKAC